MQTEREYYQLLAAAYVRGKLQTRAGETQPRLFEPELADLGDEELTQLVALANAYELHLHRFKRSMNLPRVQKVLGVLKGLQPQNLLDIGSGRGAFLWPLLDALPALAVTCVDLLEYRVADLLAMRTGGLTRLNAFQGDVTCLPCANDSFDVVTMLEVLEHVQETRTALAEVCRVARRFVLFSTPSKLDNNPEHIHLFGEQHLRALLEERGVTRIHFGYVLNHLITIASIEHL
jgi:ubiquinone/menaquinone biosynthesis C-methylase UbiE